MKYIKKTWIYVLVLLPFFGYSQNIFPTSGNVGIGTTSPESILQVENNLAQSVRFKYLYFSNPLEIATSYARTGIFNNAEYKSENGANIWKIRNIGASDAAGILFENGGVMKFISLGNIGAQERSFTHSNFISNTKMTILPNGNIGIGLTSPSSLLHLSGTHQNTKFKLTLPADINYGNTGEVSLQAWLSEPYHTWEGGGIGVNVDNMQNFPRMNTAIGQSYIRFLPNGGSMNFVTTNNSGQVFPTMNMTGGNVAIGSNALASRTLSITSTQNDVNFESSLYRTTGDNYAIRGLAIGVGANLNQGGFFTASGATNNYGLRIYNVQAGANNFALHSDSPAKSFFQGGVGIGTNNPNEKLTVLHQGSGSPFGAIGIDVTSFYTNANAVNSYFFRVRDIGAGNYVPFVIRGDGNVGIGTENPSQKLEVRGGIVSQKSSNDFGPNILVLSANSSNMGLFVRRGNTSSGEPEGTAFYSMNNNNFPLNLFLNENGSVAIGNSNTPYGYKLAVHGNMIAEKVKVKNSNAWPDFVFNKDYKLPSLSEIEKFVKENNHLPEIPSALEVEKDGQDLGEMNRLLLKKVEELTLYLIEQDKKSRIQELRIEVLESKVSELNKKSQD